MKKVLVANRGEIARRVLRTLKKMDIRSVAIYSDADANAPHVLEADQAVYVGPSPSAESYLQQDKIIQICKDLGVDGIHPGYGFLSENAGFARKLKAEGIKLIGPSAESMEVMGDKLSAKQAVKSYNVPLVPGVDQAISDVAAAKKIASEVGYPILIKASAGGGGKGMRLVQNEAEFEEQMTLAQNEARSSFGDDAVFIEKFVDQPRHIEIQVFARAIRFIYSSANARCSDVIRKL
jgi:propionyl-CoA carboxylase alpha chain